MATERKARSLKPTMVDVAEQAGVSQTTVSLVLNGTHNVRISEQTRKRVSSVARALGYRLVKRGASATGPSADKTVIGMVVDEIATDPWMAQALDGVREKAWDHGLTVILAATRSDPEMADAVFAHMAGQPLLGMIYGTIQTRQVELTPTLMRIPTVLLNCHAPGRSITSIVPGEVLGGRTATERLIAAGHRRIALIQGEVWMEASRDRLKGYRQALSNHEIPFDPGLVRPGNWEPSAGFEQTMDLMVMKNPPTAIFCANDMMAAGCYEALKELGKRIPDDVSVIGYDDREIARFARPPLTTMLLPHFEMGTLAAEYLIDRAGGLNRRPVQVKVECPIIERESVSPLSILEPL
ncbi:LacI family DNA-binding transcriptional regulator [Mesorhizobium sp. ZMM04-5]|uniref:LacI family DNA-binding transcriptional regulator n=1 Tax=Mesorhizobium marinum TaxID=3228790 RepID=A0ABV3QVC6_9HYPH